jgi:ribosomal protein S18 acetylase RimI-like enzyme
VEVKIVDVSRKNFNLIPRPADKRFNCQECFYWIGKKDGRLNQALQKKRWLAKKGKIYGSLAKLLLWGKRGKPVGFAQFGPINEFETAKMFYQNELYQDKLNAPRSGVKSRGGNATLRGWCLTCVAIQSAYRGKGLAKRLVYNILRDLKQRGVKKVDVYPLRHTSSLNQVSVGPVEFWQKLDFEIVLEDKKRVIMRKKL